MFTEIEKVHKIELFMASNKVRGSEKVQELGKVQEFNKKVTDLK